MFKIGHGVTRTCRGLTRREILEAGGLGFLGLTLAEWFGVKGAGARAAARPASARSADATDREHSCIFIFLSGGPSHFETFDPKPTAPVEIRGPYASIPTSVSGIRISELLPQIARQMDKCALIRSMVTRDMHAGTYVVSGGHRGNASLGAVLQHLQGASRRGMPPFVHVGPNGYLPGGGSLGTTFNPLIVNDPSGTVKLPEFTLTANVTPGRFQDRRELLRAVDDVRARAHNHPGITDMDANYRRAVELLTSDRVRAAFDVSREHDEVRTRYGASIFGQSCLLARRLVEAGTRFIQVNWYGEPAWHGWDVHGADLPGLVRMEAPLCPRLDQGLSALLDDLHQRGLLSSTLVVVMGEFGRTPRINAYGGRDHWPQCGSALLAGCGVPGGAVIGSSDNHGAYPATRPVNIPELAATVYRLMGINTNTDLRIRPFLGDAVPMAELI